ncbi:TPA: Rha family transcriptional regulator [Salmonella enterica subsp. enterica serovar Reading]|nr:Rha family transcriptional regulator [Salmonella enterica subsp. enterica serovar Reading]
MNSLTVNNRLSQQPGMYESRPLRHECRLPNSLVVRNHREHSLTVGDESCRNLTAGFVMEGDFMSMSFAGNQKLSELSICARAIRMSVLALYGNSGVILLSVKCRQSDGAIVEVYTKRIWSFFPVACANFFSVVKDGPLTPAARLLSILVIAVAFVPIRSATSAWVRPASLRAASISSSNANSSAMASYSAFTAGLDNILLTISSCVMVGGLRLPVMLNLLHSGLSFFEFGRWGFLCFLHEAVQHNDALASQCAVKDTPNTFRTFKANFEQTVTECFSVRGTKIRAIDTHFLRVPNVSCLQSVWQRKYLRFNFFVVVLNSVVHDSKHNKIVMLMQALDHLISGRYTVSAPHKTGAGRGNPLMTIAHNRAFAVFLCVKHGHIRIMVGRAGQPQGWPVPMVAGISTPVRLTTYQVVESLGGELSKLTIEAAIMATVPTLAQPEIRIINGQAVTSSLAVADYFIKRHADVIRKIESLECSTLFRKRNFAFTSISVNQPNGGTRKLPCYQITRDGFAFLAMGFTGKRAAQFKEAYINAFNQMEKQLSTPSVLSDAAHNASVLYSYISSIHQVWLQQLYPMLEKVESPLAVSLYDRINDAAALASLINMTLNRSEVRGRK